MYKSNTPIPTGNLNRNQEKMLEELRKNKDFIIKPCDKNLGTAIIERNEYIQRALNRHLLDDTTYKTLTRSQEISTKEKIGHTIRELISKHRDTLPGVEIHFLHSYTKTTRESHMYHMMKVHKPTMATISIVDTKNTVLGPASIWMDYHPQKEKNMITTYFQ